MGLQEKHNTVLCLDTCLAVQTGFVPLQGDTIFAPLTEVVGTLSEEQRQRWERLYMMSDRRGGTTQPLIYRHPITGVLQADSRLLVLVLGLVTGRACLHCCMPVVGRLSAGLRLSTACHLSVDDALRAWLFVHCSADIAVLTRQVTLALQQMPAFEFVVCALMIQVDIRECVKSPTCHVM